MPNARGRSEFNRANETQLYSQKELNVKSPSSEDSNSQEFRRQQADAQVSLTYFIGTGKRELLAKSF